MIDNSRKMHHREAGEHISHFLYWWWWIYSMLYTCCITCGCESARSSWSSEEIALTELLNILWNVQVQGKVTCCLHRDVRFIWKWDPKSWMYHQFLMICGPKYHLIQKEYLHFEKSWIKFLYYLWLIMGSTSISNFLFILAADTLA